MRKSKKTRDKFQLHKTLDGPYIFSTSRAIFLSDAKVLWALIYTYRNQQRNSFHFHRLNQLFKILKRIRRYELDYIEADSELQKVALIKSILGEETALRAACTVAGLGIKKLLEMKLYLPFGLIVEGALASIYFKIDPFIGELTKTLDVFVGFRNEKVMETRPLANKPQKKFKKKHKIGGERKTPSGLTFVAPKSTLPSKRKPSDSHRDEIDDIFGE
jgi:hypothetical protein